MAGTICLAIGRTGWRAGEERTPQWELDRIGWNRRTGDYWGRGIPSRGELVPAGLHLIPSRLTMALSLSICGCSQLLPMLWTSSFDDSRMPYINHPRSCHPCRYTRELVDLNLVQSNRLTRYATRCNVISKNRPHSPPIQSISKNPPLYPKCSS